MKKIFLMGLLLLVWLGSLSPAFAETGQLVFGEALPGYELEVDHPVEGRIIYEQPFKWLNNRLAWCLQMYVWTVDGTDYQTSLPFDYLTDDIIRDLELIVHTAWTLTPQHYEDYFITTLLLWERLGYSFSPTFAGTDRPNPAGLQFYSYPERRAEIFSLVEQLKRVSALHGQTFELAVGESIVLQDDSGVLASLLDQTETLNHSRFDRQGNQLTITGLSPGRDRYVFNRFQSDHVGTSLFWKNPAGYQDIATLEISTPQETVFDVIIRQPTGSIQILKQGVGQTGLAGVEFELHNTAGEVIRRGTTDNQGRLSFTNLTYGKYQLVETKTVPGYLLPEQPLVVMIDQPAPLELEITNQPTEVAVIKTDSAGEPLPGASLQLLDAAGNLVDEWLSTAQARQWQALAPGSYQVVETAAPKGYQPAEPMTIEIAEQAEQQTFQLINQPGRGEFRLIKTDVSDNQPLAGCEIAIYRMDDSLVVSGQTDETGEVRFEGLEVGEYYYVEIQAPTGYVLDSSKHEFEITDHGQVVEVSLENKPITATPVLFKHDVSTEEAIPGAVIEVYTESDELIESVTTGEDGLAQFSPLAYGRYYFLEKEAPEGYVLNPDKHWFEIREDGTIVRSHMSNRLITATPVIIKQDLASAKRLPGAVIELYDEQDSLIESKTTGPDGVAEFSPVVYGKYYVKEKQAPAGYVLEPDKHWFEVNRDGAVIRLSLANELIRGRLELTKIAAETGRPLAGAEFEIYQAEECLGRYTTDQTGRIDIPLEYGQYYIKEVVAPKGYQADDTVWQVVIDQPDQVVRLTLENHKLPDSLPNTGAGPVRLRLIIPGLMVAAGLALHRRV